MTSALANLSRPDTRIFAPEVCNLLGYELEGVAIAPREQAGVWRDAQQPGLEAAIVGMADFADKVQARANAFRLAAQRGAAKRG